MKPEPLLAAFAKIERAKTQIEELKPIISAIFEGRPYEVISYVNPDRTEETWCFRLTKQLPPFLSVRVGEILHNLRPPLDHVVCAVALQHSGSDKKTLFPFGSRKDIFESELRKQKQLPPNAIAMIKVLKPYPGGNDLLWALHKLYKGDKHSPKLIPINRQDRMRMRNLMLFSGDVMAIGPRYGQHLVTPGYTVPPNFVRPNEDMEFLTTTPGAKFETDMQPVLDVAFREIQGIQRESVVAVLYQMRQLVEGILLTFEKRFFV